MNIKELKKTLHIGMGVTPADRWKGRSERPERKKANSIRKAFAKMKNAGYPDKFTSAKEQETN